MTRKDYRLIADVLRGQRDEAERLGVSRAAAVTDTISTMMARALRDANSNFDAFRFLTACGVVTPASP